ncbi:MAG: hypothetical protein ACREJQ_08855, partial [bacterium]
TFILPPNQIPWQTGKIGHSFFRAHPLPEIGAICVICGSNARSDRAPVNFFQSLFPSALDPALTRTM